MTTTTLDPSHHTAVGRGTQLRRAVAADWTRLWTVRSTWWSLLAALGLLLAPAFGMDIQDTAQVWVPGEIAIVFAQFPLVIPAMLAVTSESATGAIRSSLQAVPRRGVLAVARAAVGVGVAAGGAVLFAATSGAVSWALLGERAEVTPSTWIASLLTIGALVAVFTLVTMGVATVLRSSAGALTVAFLIQIVLPTMLPNFGIRWLALIGEHLPGFATISLLDAFGELPITTTRAVTVLAVWAITAAGAGLWALLHRDAA